MNDSKSYAAPQPLGSVMIGGTAGEVVESRNAKFKTGDKVVTRLLEGRQKRLATALAGIPAADRKVLERLLPQMLTNLVTDKAAADHTCRYCDGGACAREGCPLPD